MVDYLHVTREGGVATLTIDRPRVRNAITSAGWDALHDLFDELARDDAVRVVVLTGAGEDFCSGADVGGDPRRGKVTDSMGCVPSVGPARPSSRCPSRRSLASMGSRRGPDSTWRSRCDFVLASDRSRFSEIFARQGLNIDFGGSFLLPRIVGMQRAKELVLLADVIDAARALEMGLVNRVVPSGELDALVEEFATKLMAGPPIALATSKKLLNQSFTSTLDEALDAEGIGQAYQFTTRDTVEAMTAFVEKRDPNFEGR